MTMPTQQNDLLYLAINKMLAKEWDPKRIWEMGIHSKLRDFLPNVFKLVMNDAPPEEIAQYLDSAVIELMELPSDLSKATNVANQAIQLKISHDHIKPYD